MVWYCGINLDVFAAHGARGVVIFVCVGMACAPFISLIHFVGAAFGGLVVFATYELSI